MSTISLSLFLDENEDYLIPLQSLFISRQPLALLVSVYHRHWYQPLEKKNNNIKMGLKEK